MQHSYNYVSSIDQLELFFGKFVDYKSQLKRVKVMVSFRQKQILSLVSGCMIHTVFGAMYTLGTITPYIASHIYYRTNPNIKVVDVSINYPTMMIAQTFGLIISMLKLQSFFQLKTLSFIGIWGFALSVLMASFMDALWSFTIFYGGFFGFFVGVAYMSPIKNTYSYFPNRKGMCAGICMMGYGIGSFIYNQIFLHLVNPNNLPANQDHIFPEEVANNFPMALKILASVYFTIGTIGCLLFIPRPVQEPLAEELMRESTHSIISQSPNQNSPKPSPWTDIKSYFGQSIQKRKQLLQIWLTVYTSSVYGVFIAYNYKQYGQIIVNNDSLITLTGSLGCVSNSLGRIFWCSMFDYLAFRTIMTVLDSCLLVCCCICIFVHNQYVYIVMVILTYFFAGSFYGLMPTQSVKIFGGQIGTKVYPFIFSGFTLASISQFAIHEFGIRKWGNEGFQAAFIGFSIVQVISIILVRVFAYTQYKDNTQQQQASEETPQKQALTN